MCPFSNQLSICIVLLLLSTPGFAEQILKHHELSEASPTAKIVPGGMGTGEVVAVRFEAESYPVQLYELQFYMGDGGDGDMSDCSSFFLKIWDDPDGAAEPGAILADTELGNGVSFEISESPALQAIAFDSDGVPGLTVHGPFRVGLVAAEKYCITQSSFPFNERPAIAVDSGVTQGANYLYGFVTGDAPGLHWHRWEEVPGIDDSSSGDFVMQVIASGAGSGGEGGEEGGVEPTPECTKAFDCDDDNQCTQDICSPTGVCFNEATTGICNLGDLCSSGDSCVQGICVAGDPVDCEDGDSCTEDHCDQSTGICEHEVIVGCDEITPPVETEEGGDESGEITEEPVPAGHGLGLESVQPAVGYYDLETGITVFGSGFVEGMTLRVGPQFLDDVEVMSDTACTATVPTGMTPGIYTLYVKVGEEEAYLSDSFEVRPRTVEEEGCQTLSPHRTTGWVVYLILCASVLFVVRRSRMRA